MTNFKYSFDVKSSEVKQLKANQKVDIKSYSYFDPIFKKRIRSIKNWRCECGQSNHYYWDNCEKCGKPCPVPRGSQL